MFSGMALEVIRQILATKDYLCAVEARFIGTMEPTMQIHGRMIYSNCGIPVPLQSGGSGVLCLLPSGSHAGQD